MVNIRYITYIDDESVIRVFKKEDFSIDSPCCIIPFAAIKKKKKEEFKKEIEKVYKEYSKIPFMD